MNKLSKKDKAQINLQSALYQVLLGILKNTPHSIKQPLKQLKKLKLTSELTDDEIVYHDKYGNKYHITLTVDKIEEQTCSTKH